jgi:hypothetical protein
MNCKSQHHDTCELVGRIVMAHVLCAASPGLGIAMRPSALLPCWRCCGWLLCHCPGSPDLTQTSEKSKMLKGGWEFFKLQSWLRNTSNRIFLGAQSSTNVERSCKSMQIWLENVRSFPLTYHECMIMHAHVPLPYMPP